MKLKDLLDAKFPLMEKFREIAPGTHKHSVNVSNFCESVALELDLDTDFLKVCGLYHDIGKMNAPDYFSENQNGKNIHDDLDPLMSYQIITRHVSDTVLLLLNQTADGEHFPERFKLLEVVSQHHGNTVLRYFYKKSKSEIDDHFRYKSIPPQSIEAAVLMICDAVEATARSLATVNELKETQDRRAVVNTNIDTLMQDGQLDDIKVGQLKKIKSVLYKELENVYHKREAYGAEKEKVDDDLKIE